MKGRGGRGKEKGREGWGVGICKSESLCDCWLCCGTLKLNRGSRQLFYLLCTLQSVHV